MRQKLKRQFFKRRAEEVAKELLGKKLVRILPSGEKLEGIIAETEAYCGVKDKACHSFGERRTERTEVMYGQAGLVYVYFTYGMHWMLNFVVSRKGDPQVVLIRGLKNVTGPARLTKYLQIGKDFYGEDITKSRRFWVERGVMKVEGIEKLPRVGIDYAGKWKEKKLRFLTRFTK